MKNWFAVARSVFTHYLFEGDAYSKREAWLYMVSRAAWHGENVGIFNCYESELATVYSWDKSKVHRFLQKLISENMIEPVSEPVSNRNRTSYRIVKYKEYQKVILDSESVSEPVVIENRTSQRTSSIYKDLNTKKHNTNKILIPLPPFPDVPEFQAALSDWFAYKQEQFRFSYKPVALKGLFSYFEGLGPERSIATIRHTISKGWKGLVEPTGSFTGKQSNAEKSASMTEYLRSQGL